MALGGLKVRAVLLDGLGTLLALEPPWEPFAAGLLRDHRIELSPLEAEWAFTAEMRYYRAHHLEGCDAASLGDLRARCAEVLHAALPGRAARALSLSELTAAMLAALRFSVYPDVRESLTLLRARGIGLVVVSNWDISLARTLDALGIGGMFDAIVTSAQVGTAKPAPAVFAAALGRVGVCAGEALHVGDDPRLDVGGARAAGVLPVLLRREGEVLGAGAAAGAGVLTISSLAELPPLV
jgi:putative hydrolase of the HAD superfamily